MVDLVTLNLAKQYTDKRLEDYIPASPSEYSSLGYTVTEKDKEKYKVNKYYIEYNAANRVTTVDLVQLLADKK
jgi:hypothetical protein